MNAKELMIGDIVKLEDGRICRFDGIGCCDNNDNNDRYAALVCLSDGYEFNEHISEILPIPLTEDMLIENGFVKEEEFEHCEYGIGFCFTLDNEKGYIEIYFRDSFETMTSAGTITTEPSVLYLLITSKGCRYESIKLDNQFYIHELQHVLRLCGLTELSENFKMEGGEKMTKQECEALKKDYEKALKEYGETHEYCHSEMCHFYKEGIVGNCKFYHYYADDCDDYSAVE